MKTFLLLLFAVRSAASELADLLRIREHICEDVTGVLGSLDCINKHINEMNRAVSLVIKPSLFGNIPGVKSAKNFKNWLFRQQFSEEVDSGEDALIAAAKAAAKNAIGSLKDLIYIERDDKTLRDLFSSKPANTASSQTEGSSAQAGGPWEMDVIRLGVKKQWEEAVDLLIFYEKSKQPKGVASEKTLGARDDVDKGTATDVNAPVQKISDLLIKYAGLSDGIPMSDGAANSQSVDLSAQVLVSKQIPEGQISGLKQHVIDVFKNEGNFAKKEARALSDREASLITDALNHGTRASHSEVNDAIKAQCQKLKSIPNSEFGAWKDCKKALGYREPDNMGKLRLTHAKITDAELAIGVGSKLKTRTDTAEGLNILRLYQVAEMEAAGFLGFHTPKNLFKYYKHWNPKVNHGDATRSFKFRFQVTTRIWMLRLKLAQWMKADIEARAQQMSSRQEQSSQKIAKVGVTEISSLGPEQLQISTGVAENPSEAPLTFSDLEDLIEESYALLLKQWAFLHCKEREMMNKGLSTYLPIISRVITSVYYGRSPVSSSPAWEVKQLFSNARFAFSATEIAWMQSLSQIAVQLKIGSVVFPDSSSPLYPPAPNLADWANDNAQTEKNRLHKLLIPWIDKGATQVALGITFNLFWPPQLVSVLFNTPSVLRQAYRRDKHYRKFQAKQVQQKTLRGEKYKKTLQEIKRRSSKQGDA